MRDFFHTSIAATICLFSFLITTLTPTASAQYIGTIDTVGTTWYDLQHVGSCGRMISLDNMGNIHVCWTNGLEAWAANRHVYYNLRYLSSGWSFGSQGVTVESSYRAGFCNIDIDSTGRPNIIFTATNQLGDPPHIVLARDLFPGAGAFAICDLPPPPPDVEGLMHPKIAIDINGRIHVIAHEYGSPGPGFRIFYCQDEYLEWIQVAWSTTFATDITASRYSDRVGLVYTGIRTTIYGDTNSINNDILLVISEDGVSWDFNNPINITEFIPPDTTHPDTTRAKGDTLRPYKDASILIDYLDDFHIAFTTIYYDEINNGMQRYNSLIWHWSENHQDFSLIGDGWWDAYPGGGAWQRNVQRPCLAFDEQRHEMYCTWMKFDTADLAENCYLQSELMVSWSDNEGRNWTVPTNVTNTHAPNGEAGQCFHERAVTTNETVVNDTLHLLYLSDKDAGTVIYDEGTWTLNPIISQHVPINEIAHSPWMPYMPFHIDTLSVEKIENSNIPTEFHLSQNYPNPFNPITTIQFDLHRTDHITLKIYNTLGREIKTLVDANLTPGTYKVPFTAENLSSGIYFYTLTSSTRTQTKKMVLLK